GPINQRAMPAAHSRRGMSGSAFHPVFPSRVTDAATAAIDLAALDRLQHVESAGKRNLFRFVTDSHIIHAPPTPPGSTKNQAIVPNVPVRLATDADPSPLVFYGYVLRRG